MGRLVTNFSPFFSTRMTEEKFKFTVPLTLDTKTLYAQVFVAVQNLGVSRAKLMDELNRLGSNLKKNTVARWVKETLLTGTAESPQKLSGNSAALSELEHRILIGWVLNQNILKEKVMRRNCAKFLKDAFDITIHPSTIGRYLNDGGITNKKQRTKGPGYKLSLTQQCKIYLDFVQDIRRKHYLDFPADHIACIDFTFTGHRSTTEFGFSARGSGQTQVNTDFSNYTNCIVTCIWADGSLTHPQCSLHSTPSSIGSEIELKSEPQDKTTTATSWKNMESTTNASFTWA